MKREPRVRLPLAGVLIIFVAPLASLMVIVPSLFAGSVHKVQTAVPAIISRLVPNPSPHQHAPRFTSPGLPPVALGHPNHPAPLTPATIHAVSGAGAPPAAAPSPAAAAAQPLVQTATASGKTNHGRKRRRRPHQDLDT